MAVYPWNVHFSFTGWWAAVVDHEVNNLGRVGVVISVVRASCLNISQQGALGTPGRRQYSQ
jgi:hypothetical protein